MCCANKIGPLATGLIPLGLIAEEAKLLIDEGLFRSAENPRLREYQDHTARNGLPDAEHKGRTGTGACLGRRRAGQ